MNAEIIDLYQESHVCYWTTLLGCSEVQLREALGNVGTQASAVQLYMRTPHSLEARLHTEHMRMVHTIKQTIHLLQDHLLLY